MRVSGGPRRLTRVRPGDPRGDPRTPARRKGGTAAALRAAASSRKRCCGSKQTTRSPRSRPYNGFFIQYGYTGKPVGSGIAFGGGWRHDLFDRNARVVLEGGQSLRGYRMVRADFSLPRLLEALLEIGVEATYRSHPQEDFYGLGFDSIGTTASTSDIRAPEVQGRAS